MKDINVKISCIFPFIICLLLILAAEGIIAKLVYSIIASVTALYFFPAKYFLKGDLISTRFSEKMIVYAGYFFYSVTIVLSVFLLHIYTNVLFSVCQFITLSYLFFLLMTLIVKKFDWCKITMCAGFYLLNIIVYLIS